MWNSLPIDIGLVTNGLRALHGVEQYSGHATTRPAGGTTMWNSLPVDGGLVQNGLTSLHGVEQHGGRGEQFGSLPVTVSDSSMCGFTTQLPTSLSKQVGTSPMTSQQKCTSDHMQVVSAEPVVKSQLVTLVDDARLLPSAVPATDRLLGVRSPVGQITGTMGGLSIDSNCHHPLLRGMLTDPAYEIVGTDLMKNPTDQVIVLCVCLS